MSQGLAVGLPAPLMHPGRLSPVKSTLQGRDVDACEKIKTKHCCDRYRTICVELCIAQGHEDKVIDVHDMVHERSS